jgi:hypothetical protein
MPEVDVAAWKDPALIILRRGPYTTVETAGHIKQDRKWLDEMRAPGAELAFPWLQCRTSQLAAFYLTLSRWYGHRELIMDKHGIDYCGEDQ